MLSFALLTSMIVAQAAPLCEDPNLLFLLDVSGTMKQLVGNQTKYVHAVNAIDAITTERTDIRYGLSVFPKPFKSGTPQSGYCFMNSGMVVDFSDTAGTAIKNYLSPTGSNYFGGPESNNDTPIYQALEQANTFNGFNDGARRQAMVLITDGIQDCCRGRYLFPSASPPQDFNSTSDCPNYPDVTLGEAEKVNNRSAIVALTAQVAARGVSVFVVGFGSQVDPLMLGAMAVAAGTQRPNCNPNQANGNANDICYYRANNAAELTAALQTVAREITTEVCDNIDNDCNGIIDDGVSRACQGCNGVGTEQCVGGQWTGQCSAPKQPEICDGIDNDCDGKTDSLDCMSACGPGTRTCEGGALGICRPSASIEELCNERDDNCDGQVDEGCECVNDEIRPCNSNSCAGQQRCVYGKWSSACETPNASAEKCDGEDNDCDGKVDEGYDLCGPGLSCINGKCPTRTLDTPVDAENERFLGSGLARGCSASGLTSPLGIILAGLGLSRLFRRRE